MTRKKEQVFAALFGLVVAGLVYAASQTVLYWPFLNIQNKINDSHFVLRHNLKGLDETAHDDIVIVDFDDRTINTIGRIKSKRWPRRHMGKAIGNLKRDGAGLIFLDIIFEGRTRDDINLADSLKSAGNVVAGYYFKLDAQSKKKRPLDPVLNEQFSNGMMNPEDFDRERFIKAHGIVLPNYNLVKSVAALGFTNYIPDPDGILRHIPLYIASGAKGSIVSPSAALQLWLRLKGIHYSAAKITRRGIQFGDTFIPTDRHFFLRLNYSAADSLYPYIPFIDVLNGDFEAGTFTDKIVMIGSSSEKVGDLKKIPVYGTLPGVEIHATALSTLLRENYISVVPGNIVLALSIVLGIVTSLLFTFAHPIKTGLPVAVVLPFVLYGAAVYTFFSFSMLFNISIPAFVVVFLYVVHTIHRMIEHYEKSHLM